MGICTLQTQVISILFSYVLNSSVLGHVGCRDGALKQSKAVSEILSSSRGRCRKMSAGCHGTGQCRAVMFSTRLQEVMFEQGPKECEGIIHVHTQEKSLLDRGDSTVRKP